MNRPDVYQQIEERRTRAKTRSRERRERLDFTIDQARWNAWVRRFRWPRRPA